VPAAREVDATVVGDDVVGVDDVDEGAELPVDADVVSTVALVVPVDDGVDEPVDDEDVPVEPDVEDKLVDPDDEDDVLLDPDDDDDELLDPDEDEPPDAGAAEPTDFSVSAPVPPRNTTGMLD
jgi:hypothetical protein